MNPRVKEILSIKPYIIEALWSDDKVRKIDFGSFLSDYFQKEQSHYYKILNEQRFLEAKTDGRTIYWDDVSEMVDYDGKLIPAPLDFCPDVLFEQSVLAD
ncbi:hypothetical protein [Dyadobacter psychrophilus]|uniref:DUF2442 domain-containing protein n=1 Tax=Dyadobacter psychrophilus TaxID=651661 RepID=A0A1T5GP85_9BACT|nr:hypothetical protein [Dyadobacter psychrophilus]SKC10209.1 hypothetical protein SAMN05660293_04204 [Dyadobacter psychrophilus]